MVSEEALGSLRLEVTSLYHQFDGVDVVNNVSLSVRPGQVTCLLGPSGCGKTTTLRIIAGVERQQKGKILLDGTLVSDSKTHLEPDKRRVGLIFQDFALFPHLNIEENVGFGLEGRNSKNSSRISQLLSRVGLDGFQKKYPHQLSGGEQQMLSIGRALLTNPDLLILDEATEGLAPLIAQDIWNIIGVVKDSGISTLIVDKNFKSLSKISNRCVVMVKGGIVFNDISSKLISRPEALKNWLGV